MHAVPCCGALAQGDAQVLVERRGGEHQAYGQGRKVKMSFASFVERVAAGDTRLYLASSKVCGSNRQARGTIVNLNGMHLCTINAFMHNTPCAFRGSGRGRAFASSSISLRASQRLPA